MAEKQPNRLSEETLSRIADLWNQRYLTGKPGPHRIRALAAGEADVILVSYDRSQLLDKIEVIKKPPETPQDSI